MTAEPCRRCEHEGRHTEGDITAYWGHVLCRPCAVRTAEEMDERDRWPEVPWSDEDLEALS